VVINPRQIRDFARSVGTRAKTDFLDAKVIANFAAKIQPAPRILPTEAAKKLGDILVRRRQIVTMRTTEKNRLQQAAPSVMKRVKAHVKWLEKELSDINTELRQMVQDDPEWQKKDEIIQSVPGVGPNLSVTY